MASIADTLSAITPSASKIRPDVRDALLDLRVKGVARANLLTRCQSSGWTLDDREIAPIYDDLEPWRYSVLCLPDDEVALLQFPSYVIDTADYSRPLSEVMTSVGDMLRSSKIRVIADRVSVPHRSLQRLFDRFEHEYDAKFLAWVLLLRELVQGVPITQIIDPTSERGDPSASHDARAHRPAGSLAKNITISASVALGMTAVGTLGLLAGGRLAATDEAPADVWVKVIVEDHQERPVAGAQVQIGGDGGSCTTAATGDCTLKLGNFPGGAKKTLRVDFDGRSRKLEVDLDTMRAGVTVTLPRPTTKCTVSFIGDDGTRITDLAKVDVLVGRERPEVHLAIGEASFECEGLIGREARIIAVTPKQREIEWTETLQPVLSLIWGSGTCEVTFVLDGELLTDLIDVEVYSEIDGKPLRTQASEHSIDDSRHEKGKFEFRCLPRSKSGEQPAVVYRVKRAGEYVKFPRASFEPHTTLDWADGQRASDP